MPHETCADCTNNCARLHQENKPTSRIARFFKVMFGKDHDKVMPLPPDTAPSVKHLAGERFLLEDADGRKCSVLLSHFEGSLAFTEGWFSFFREHKLEETSFLTFEYTEGSKIIFVRVFAKSGVETVHINRKGNFRRRVPNDEANPGIEENLNDESSPENMVLELNKNEVEVEMVSPIGASMGIQRESDMSDAADKSGDDIDVNRILTNPEATKIPEKFDIGSAAEAIDSNFSSVDEVIEIEEDCDVKTPDAETEVDKHGSNIGITEQNKRNKNSQKDPVFESPVLFTGQTKRKFSGEPMKNVIEPGKFSGLKVTSKIGNKAEKKAKGRETQMAANHDVEGDGDRAKAVPNKRSNDGSLSKKIPDSSRDSMNRRSNEAIQTETLKKASPASSSVPFFEVTITASSISPGAQVIPKKFQDKHLGGCNKMEMILKDWKGVSWLVGVNPWGRKYARFTKGWKAFVEGNNLKEGDVCIFKLVEKNVMEVHIVLVV